MQKTDISAARLTETHPLAPFMPAHARLLMLGSFPPKRERWSMDFFYPNFNNDMWRIVGLIFFGDKSRFITADGRHFDREQITEFCTLHGIALYDTAEEVRRLKDNASDKFLEIVRKTDLKAMLRRSPEFPAVAATGQKAVEAAASELGCDVPAVGKFTEFTLSLNGTAQKMRLWRMPSSSRAYPMSIENKAVFYREMFLSEKLLIPEHHSAAECSSSERVG